MAKKQSECESNPARVFEGTKKGAPFTVTTTLTDEQAIAALREGSNGVGFASDCADQIELMVLASERKLPVKFKPNLIAWGFRMAEEKINRPSVTLHPSYRKKVAFRKPLTFAVDGEVVSISLCGPGSAHAGKYRISNGQKYGHPEQKFYGYASPDGAWNVTQATPSNVVEALMNGK